MGKKHTTKAAELRAEYLRRGLPCRASEPQPGPVWVVRYVRMNGDVMSRYFVLEHAARAYADRLKSYGKDPSIFHTSRPVHWTQVA